MQTKIEFMITNRDLHRACTQNKYLMLTFKGGENTVINCKVGLFKKYERFAQDDIDTLIESIRPISFSEYLLFKKPFIV